MAQFKNDQPIIINVNEESTSGDTEQKKRKITFQPTRGLVFRRKIPTQGFINFYDLGQKWNEDSEVWENNLYVHDPAPVVVPSPDPTHSSDQSEDSSPLSISHFRTLEATILSTPTTAFETTFRKIEKTAGNAFPIQLTIDGIGTYTFDSEEWTDNGLKFEQSQIHNRSIGVIVRKTDISGVGSQSFTQDLGVDPSISKITNLPLYTAPEVTFAPKIGDTYFLMPALCLNYGYSVQGGFHTATEIYLDYQHRILPRDFSNPDKMWSAYADPAPPGGSNANFAAVLSSNLSLPSIHALQYDFVGENYPPATGWVERLTISTIAAGSFPVGYDPMPYISFLSPFITIGTLLGIIKQNNKVFYFWSKYSNF